MGKLVRFFWIASIATRIKLGNIRMSSSRVESRNYIHPHAVRQVSGGWAISQRTAGTAYFPRGTLRL